MNGRAYDYNLGRFLSVDPIIQSPGNSQSLNPYSYIMNNPLAGTDPTGYMGCAASRIKSVCDNTFLLWGGNGEADKKKAEKDALGNGSKNYPPANSQETPTTEIGSQQKSSEAGAGGQWTNQDGSQSGSPSSFNGTEMAGAMVMTPWGPLPVGPKTPEQTALDEVAALALDKKLTSVAKELAGSFGSPSMPPDDEDKMNLRKGDNEYTKVGRWMSSEEYKLMEKTGKVQQGAGGQTFVSTSGSNSFYSQAKSGSVYVEFKVPTNSLIQGGRADWFKLIGPDAPKSQQMLLKRQGGNILPQAKEITVRYFKS